MNEHRWVRLTSCASIPPREGREVVVGGRHIAVFNLGDRFFATDNRCPHRGGPLCDGIVTGAAVVCPLHAWKVNLATGTVERPEGANACVQTYPLRVENDVILLGLPEAELRRERDDGFNAEYAGSGGERRDDLNAERAEGAENHSRDISACSAHSALNPSRRPPPTPRTGEAARRW